MALGATASQVQFGVIAKTLRLAFIGIALGTIGSLAAARWIASLLFATDSHRSRNLCGNYSPPQCRGVYCRVYTRAPGNEGQSHGRVALPMTTHIATFPSGVQNENVG